MCTTPKPPTPLFNSAKRVTSLITSKALVGVASMIVGSIVLAACISLPASAACVKGGKPDYSEVTDIGFRSCGAEKQKFIFGVARNGSLWFARSRGNAFGGGYSGSDGVALFNSLVGALKSYDFYDLRLRSAKTDYVDGPCYTIEVLQCGVGTVVGTLHADLLPFEADLKDRSTHEFLALARDMEKDILAWPWSHEYKEGSAAPTR